ncbi:helix-turn-helix transcriptional regulator [Cobetia sp. LC6]|uniref:helix-turn-helix domain-containing protein n=1 Tax=Cobetia sp. LC6 TaxID=3050947 RepID=UPI002555665A|nr:helix-turn-helix transcriptional regulator [Cobetia sp. LC6]MDL2191883.1 helix-turn-helix transcriptional regulator [Cobetia sp. LC6]
MSVTTPVLPSSPGVSTRGPDQVPFSSSVCEHDPDIYEIPASALHVETGQQVMEVPTHQHRKGQLVIVLHGVVTSRVPEGLWMVPPHSGVWIPGNLPHSNHLTRGGRVCHLFIEPGALEMPSHSCTLSISPLLRELVLRLAELPQPYPEQGPTARLVGVLLEELACMPSERLHLPLPEDPRLTRISDALIKTPDDRRTLAEWASELAMSERTLARLIQRDTGLSFSRWRQQLHLVVAIRLLAEGMSVQRVSEDVGYQSVNAFISMFKKLLGTTPARYLQEREQRRSGSGMGGNSRVMTQRESGGL